MASSLNGTGLTFSSGQTLNALPVTSFVGQTGAVDPTVFNSIGSIVSAVYNQTINVPGTDQANTYPIDTNTTVAGSTLLYNIKTSALSSNGNYYGGISQGLFKLNPGSPSSVPASPFNGGYNWFSYSTGLSGSWRAMSSAGATASQPACQPSRVSWVAGLWVRYA